MKNRISFILKLFFKFISIYLQTINIRKSHSILSFLFSPERRSCGVITNALE